VVRKVWRDPLTMSQLPPHEAHVTITNQTTGATWRLTCPPAPPGQLETCGVVRGQPRVADQLTVHESPPLHWQPTNLGSPFPVGSDRSDFFCTDDTTVSPARRTCLLTIDNEFHPAALLTLTKRWLDVLGLDTAGPSTTLVVSADGIDYPVACPAGQSPVRCQPLPLPSSPTTLEITEPNSPPGWTPIAGLGDLSSATCWPSCQHTVVNRARDLHVTIQKLWLSSTGARPPLSATLTLSAPQGSLTITCPPPPPGQSLVDCTPSPITLIDWLDTRGPITLQEDLIPSRWQTFAGTGSWDSSTVVHQDREHPLIEGPAWALSGGNHLTIQVSNRPSDEASQYPVYLMVITRWLDRAPQAPRRPSRSTSPTPPANRCAR
jgi:hypothetical protein